MLPSNNSLQNCYVYDLIEHRQNTNTRRMYRHLCTVQYTIVGEQQTSINALKTIHPFNVCAMHKYTDTHSNIHLTLFAKLELGEKECELRYFIVVILRISIYTHYTLLPFNFVFSLFFSFHFNI
jgi:hypothetical protein